MKRIILTILLVSFEATSHGPFREGVKVINNKDELKTIKDINLETINKKKASFKSILGNKKGLVVLTSDINCPVSQKLRPFVKKVYNDYKDHFAFVFINYNKFEEVKAIRKHIKEEGFDFSYIHDTEQEIFKLLKPNTTTESFVLTPSLKVIYRGSISDQFGIGFEKKNQKSITSYLTVALDNHLKGQPIVNFHTSAPGCYL